MVSSNQRHDLARWQLLRRTEKPSTRPKSRRSHAHSPTEVMNAAVPSTVLDEPGHGVRPQSLPTMDA